eukprot:CAMPEP_0116084284 /NCGR_PEP_ID=MMETSP0327-20121206/3723_1 /TAXON_ID=44447 /ORGANISM="Pseudo-nitzschia delicatissima, Strain B596" /LENGTH=1200 /DNA_ID=CAMNT_0003575225 /DNA_START=17 /DNA_END=3619 /DNA_ORIENTATION=-
MDGSFDKLTVQPSTSGSTTSASASAHSSSTSSSPNYIQGQSSVAKRRNELLEKLSRNSPSKQHTTTKQRHTYEGGSPNRFYRLSTSEKDSQGEQSDEKPLSPPKLRAGLNSIDDGNRRTKTIPNTSFSTPEPQKARQQTGKAQHDQNEEQSGVNYYRIVYRGIVALLDDGGDNDDNKEYNKTGAYLGYGEIIASSSEKLVEDTTARPRRRIHASPRLGSAVDSPILAKVWDNKEQEEKLVCSSPPRSLVSGASSGVSSFTAASAPTKMRKVIRVDRVLTGGYAFDANEQENSESESPASFSKNVKACDSTPKRGNTQSMADIVVPRSGSSLLPISDNNSIIRELTHDNEDDIEIEIAKSKHGYVFSEEANNLVAMAIPIEVVPKCEHGRFMYRVISSTPLTILTGPCLDAPKSKGILIPGTIHEVCLRVTGVEEEKQKHWTDSNSVSFLRLTRRRGWVLSGRNITKRQDLGDNSNASSSWVPLMKEISDDEIDGCGLSVVSRGTTKTTTSLLVTPVSVANRRHRPPRRKHGGRNDTIESTPLPRHVVGPSLQQGNDASALTDTSTSTSMNNSQLNSDPRSIISPSSNISLLSDDTSSVDPASKSQGGTLSPDRSVARSAASSTLHPSFFLMRVNAPRGLKILDAPHFQVNNLIHGNHSTTPGIHDGYSSSATPVKDLYGKSSGAGNQSIFQTMAGHHTTTMTSKTSNPAVFDSITKARKLPRGSVFEATKRMEASNAFSQGAGLIKLSDNSGWAIIPRQSELNDQYRGYSGALLHSREGEATRAFDEVGNSMGNACQETIFLRVISRGGVSVSLPPIPNTDSDADTSPTSSATGSSVLSSNGLPLLSAAVSHDSDVASSVGSSFLDSMFRTPKRKERLPESINENRSDHQHFHNRPPTAERHIISTIIPCGTCVEVDRWVDPSDLEHHVFKNEFARIRGGQGWIPRFSNGKPIVETIMRPDFRFGSFWFRVSDQRGIKVRLGPSKKASSIKSDDGVYFRFECGEFLRASEIVTFSKHNAKHECFAKLYRNRHVRLHAGELRPLSSLTAQAEWVQVFGEKNIFLEECETEPRIERHRQGWRYNVVLDARVTVRKGPSFEADTDDVVLLGGESVLVNERVTGPDDTITWLRLKDGHGWVHTIGQTGESLMIAHSLRHRKPTVGRPTKASRTKQEDIAYNTIVARLFHNNVPGESPPRTMPRK